MSDHDAPDPDGRDLGRADQRTPDHGGPRHPLVGRLGLDRHPEGGWFRRTWTSPLVVDAATDRRAGSAILYLLHPGEVSAWHRVLDADELWLVHEGSALLHLSPDGVTEQVVALGAAADAGQHPQVLVPAGWWQSAEPVDGHVLVSCAVTPEFRPEGFELAPPCWSPGSDSA